MTTAEATTCPAGEAPVERRVMAPATVRRMRVLSICTGMGLLDRAFIDAGFDVTAGCEIDAQKRAMYSALCGGQPIHHTLERLVDVGDGGGWDFVPDGIIGGPSCQSHSKLRAIRDPKFPDLTPLVNELLDLAQPRWFLFENVVPIDIPGAVHTRCNAMHSVL